MDTRYALSFWREGEQDGDPFWSEWFEVPPLVPAVGELVVLTEGIVTTAALPRQQRYIVVSREFWYTRRGRGSAPVHDWTEMAVEVVVRPVEQERP